MPPVIFFNLLHDFFLKSRLLEKYSVDYCFLIFLRGGEAPPPPPGTDGPDGTDGRTGLKGPAPENSWKLRSRRHPEALRLMDAMPELTLSPDLAVYDAVISARPAELHSPLKGFKTPPRTFQVRSTGPSRRSTAAREQVRAGLPCS